MILFVCLPFSVWVVWVLAVDFVVPVLRLSYNSILWLFCAVGCLDLKYLC